MTTTAITMQIISHLDELSLDQQQQILDLMRSFLKPRGRPGKEILQLAGTISSTDLEIMRQVAEEECEGVDIDEW